VTCVLSPEMTEGPYYVAADAKIRKDIRGGVPGTPLALKLGVANVATCKPIAGAAVDIWHADAGGVYSDEQQNNTVGQTFLRGVQPTNASGIAAFTTIYPGWYQGRTVHIHVKVARRRQRHPYRTALLRRCAHRQGLREDAVFIASESNHAQRERLDLRQRRQPLDAHGQEAGLGLRRLDLDGRSRLAGAGGTCPGV